MCAHKFVRQVDGRQFWSSLPKSFAVAWGRPGARKLHHTGTAAELEPEIGRALDLGLLTSCRLARLPHLAELRALSSRHLPRLPIFGSWRCHQFSQEVSNAVWPTWLYMINRMIIQYWDNEKNIVVLVSTLKLYNRNSKHYPPATFLTYPFLTLRDVISSHKMCQMRCDLLDFAWPAGWSSTIEITSSPLPGILVGRPGVRSVALLSGMISRSVKPHLNSTAAFLASSSSLWGINCRGGRAQSWC